MITGLTAFLVKVKTVRFYYPGYCSSPRPPHLHSTYNKNPAHGLFDKSLKLMVATGVPEPPTPAL